MRRIVIVSTRYLDQPASRLGLPRRTRVKDLLFLFLHWNPIGKSAEAFVRALPFTQPLLSRSRIICVHIARLSLASSSPLCFVRDDHEFAVIRVRIVAIKRRPLFLVSLSLSKILVVERESYDRTVSTSCRVAGYIVLGRRLELMNKLAPRIQLSSFPFLVFRAICSKPTLFFGEEKKEPRQE